VSFVSSAIAGTEGVIDSEAPATVGVLPAERVALVGDGVAEMVNVDTIDGVGSKASPLGASETPSPPVVDVSGVAGGTVVVVLVLGLVVVVGAIVVVIDEAGTVVVVDVLGTPVVVAVAGTIGRDRAWLRLRSLPAHCVVPSGTAPTSRVLSTSRAVRLVGSRSDCGDSGVPPTVAVERCTANGPTGQSSICGWEGSYVEVGFDHNSSSEPSRAATPVVVLTVPARSLMAAARTVRSPNAEDVAIGTSTGVNARVLLGMVKVPSEATPTVIGTGVVNVATSVVLVRIAKLTEMRTGTRAPRSASACERHIGPTITTTTV